MVVEENPAISRNRHRIFGEYLSRKIPEAAGWFLAILDPRGLSQIWRCIPLIPTQGGSGMCISVIQSQSRPVRATE